MSGRERMLITGGNPLEGEVQVSGGKNTAVALIPASLLCDEPCVIENLPDIEDVHALVDILRELGAKVDYEPGHMMRVDPRPAEGDTVSFRNARGLRYRQPPGGSAYQGHAGPGRRRGGAPGHPAGQHR